MIPDQIIENASDRRNSHVGRGQHPLFIPKSGAQEAQGPTALFGGDPGGHRETDPEGEGGRKFVLGIGKLDEEISPAAPGKPGETEGGRLAVPVGSQRHLVSGNSDQELAADLLLEGQIDPCGVKAVGQAKILLGVAGADVFIGGGVDKIAGSLRKVHKDQAADGETLSEIGPPHRPLLPDR